MTSETSDWPRRERPGASARLDAEAVRAAYRRWASVYDTVFGSIWARARRRAVDAVNELPGERILEVGVGTGLALPWYRPEKRIVGIDLSAEMLAHARERARSLPNVEGLHEVDAEATGFPDNSFDIAMAMFVASVVPHPRRLLAEMKRVVRPGGYLLFANHFRAQGGPRLLVERALAPAGRQLGWHPTFCLEDLLGAEDFRSAKLEKLPPLGLFTLLQLVN